MDKDQKASEIKFNLGDNIEYAKLNDVCNVISGGTPSTSEPQYWDNGSIEWFTPSEIGVSKYIRYSKRKITELGLKNSSAKFIPSNSILLSTRATVGEVSINQIKCTTNQGFQSLVPFNIELNYMYYLMIKNKDRLIKLSTGSTFLEISSSEIKNFNLKIHDKNNQKIIGEFLSSMDILIELNEKYIKLLRKKEKNEN